MSSHLGVYNTCYFNLVVFFVCESDSNSHFHFCRNPSVPGQKLKVQIPKNADMEKRRFVVSIPTPKVTEPVEIRDNNFSRAFREALFNYSNAFDEWCNAEGWFFHWRAICYRVCFLFPEHTTHICPTSFVMLMYQFHRRTQ